MWRVAHAARPQATLFAGVHRGFAPPRVEDVINNTTGGVVELDPERSWNFEVGARTRSRSGVRARWHLLPDGLREPDRAGEPRGRRGRHADQRRRDAPSGIELGGAFDRRSFTDCLHDVYRAHGLHLRIPVARFTGIRLSNVSRASPTVSVSGNRLPYAPETSRHGDGSAIAHALGLDLQLEAQSLGEQFGDDLNTIERLGGRSARTDSRPHAMECRRDVARRASRDVVLRRREESRGSDGDHRSLARHPPDASPPRAGRHVVAVLAASESVASRITDASRFTIHGV